METITNLPIKVPPVSLDHIEDKELSLLADNILALLNLSGVDTNRATHYNTKEEIEKARVALHKAVFSIDRSIYGCLFCLPGVTDFARQKAVTAMLGNPWENPSNGVLTIDHEKKIIKFLTSSLQANRMINLFVNLKKERVNNSRTREVILSSLLNSKSLELWAVKYRDKLKAALEHTWNVRRTGILKSILNGKLGNYRFDEKEKSIIYDLVGKYLEGSSRPFVNKVLQCVSFILGNDEEYTLDLLKAFKETKTDISKGSRLPIEVLEGLRSTYHKDTPHAQVLELTKKTMTTKQKRLVQKSAKKAGVKVDFDPRKYPMVDLYIYAFEMGWSKEIAKALKEKAIVAAQSLPFHFDRIGILVDDSESMRGSEDQKLRPAAVTLATRDLLACAGNKAIVITSSGKKTGLGQMVHPGGETDISESFLKLLENEPDSIFILSDGYENAPAGRFSEVLMLVRKIGATTPIYHINPVAAAESKSAIRQLDETVSTLPISNPQQIGLTLFKAMLETDPKKGLLSLIGVALPLIETQKEVAA